MSGAKINKFNVNQVKKRFGLQKGGPAQKHWTQNIVTPHLLPYEPYRTNGSVVNATRQGAAPPYDKIVIRGPHIRYLYMGKAMAGRAPKYVTDRDLRYTKSPHPKAGPFWDRRMKQNEMGELEEEMTAWLKQK